MSPTIKSVALISTLCTVMLKSHFFSSFTNVVAHGGHYFDIGSGHGEYNVTENEERLETYNPVLRDTTVLYKYTAGDALGKPAYSVQGWRAWRIRIIDPDVWIIHCHTLQHLIMGMQTVWVMGNAEQITSKTLGVDVSGYLTYGGSVYGNHYF